LVQICFIAFDLPAHFQSGGLVNGAVIFHLLGIPATADAEQEAALRHLVSEATSFAVWIVSRWITKQIAVPSLTPYYCR
jgi:hypothetical protein